MHFGAEQCEFDAWHDRSVAPTAIAKQESAVNCEANTNQASKHSGQLHSGLSKSFFHELGSE